MTRNCAIFSVFCFALTAIGLSQPIDPAFKKDWGYFYGAPGAFAGDGETHATIHFGGGGQTLLSGGFGLSFDAGYVSSMERIGAGVGILQPGIVYAFNREQKTVPFVTGGYSLMFRQGAASGFFVGGGVNRWVNQRFGWRIEGRDSILPQYNTHLVEARFSLLLR